MITAEQTAASIILVHVHIHLQKIQLIVHKIRSMWEMQNNYQIYFLHTINSYHKFNVHIF
jgi:hypothetical protein